MPASHRVKAGLCRARGAAASSAPLRSAERHPRGLLARRPDASPIPWGPRRLRAPPGASTPVAEGVSWTISAMTRRRECASAGRLLSPARSPAQATGTTPCTHAPAGYPHPAKGDRSASTGIGRDTTTRGLDAPRTAGNRRKRPRASLLDNSSIRCYDMQHILHLTPASTRAHNGKHLHGKTAGWKFPMIGHTPRPHRRKTLTGDRVMRGSRPDDG